MSMTMKLILSCAGVFLGGSGASYQVHTTDVMNARFWIGLAFAGLIPLGTYFVGLSQKAPWDGPKP